MTRNSGCLGSLPRGQRRVLELRAGVGPRTPHTRASTAAILDVSRATVVRRERAGIRRLRRLDCGAATTGAPVSGPMARGLGLALAAAAANGGGATASDELLAAAAKPGDDAPGADNAVKDATADSGSGAPTTDPGTIQLPSTDGAGGNAMVLAALGALTLLGFAALAVEKRRRRYLL